MTMTQKRTPKTRAATKLEADPTGLSSLRAPSPQPTIFPSTPTTSPSAGAQLPDGQIRHDAQISLAVGTPSASSQAPDDAQDSLAAGTLSQSDGGDQSRIDTHGSAAVPDGWGYVHLTFMARVLDDIEGQRKTTDNRVRILTAADPDSDGVVRGFNLTDDHPAVAALSAYADALKDSEKKIIRELERSMKVHPLGPWVMAQKGVGLKQAARLLSAVGDPYWNTLHDRPRTVSELWAYCGYKPGQKRTKGQRSNWSNDAKMRAWNIVQSIIKTKGQWRDLWDERREFYRGRYHDAPCQVCAGKGKDPAGVIGQPWEDGHQKAATDRYVAKRLLLELWRESKRLHELAESQDGADAQSCVALGTPSPDGQATTDIHTTPAVGTNPEESK